jgi:TetR/AcrR family transcriptional regulator, cholesterol catabolism regulator
LTERSIQKGFFLKDSRPADVKESIIRESTRLFLAKGFRGTSVKEITEAAGIGRGTLYWYFKSKDEILLTIFRNFENGMLDPLIEALKHLKGDFTAKYKFLHKSTTEFARDNRDLSLAFHTLSSEMAGTRTEAEKVAKSVHDKFRGIIKRLLDEGKKNGSIRKDLPSALYSHVIVAHHHGMLFQWLTCGDSLDARDFARATRDFILKGILQKDT